MRPFSLSRGFFFQLLVVMFFSLLLAHTAAAFAVNLTVIQDHAFIDNRPTDDPLLTGLNLNLEVTVTDSVGGNAALSGGTATFTSSNPSFPFSGTMSWDSGRNRFVYTHIVTPAQFSSITGTFTFTITDANGTVQDTSHPLDYLEMLQFPTNMQFSNQSTTAAFTFTDPNPGPPSGIIRAYQLQIYQVVSGNLVGVYASSYHLTPSFALPRGVLTIGHAYDFRVSIIDADIAEIGQAIHDATESRSNGWAFNFAPATTAVKTNTNDFDGDGKTDIGIFHPSTGSWFIIPSSTGVPYGVAWGSSTDTPVPGDYDGDGKTDIAIFHPSTGSWFVIPSSTGVAYGVAWGSSTDIPVPGDYDGDGKTDIAIYHPDTGSWFVIPSSTGVAYGVAWGSSTDIPLTQ